MSYFCFGEIVLADEAKMAEAAWEMVRAGQEENLSILCGPNIVQKNVLEMLAARVEKNPRAISFLVTGGPLEDTSDTLISPYASTDGVDGVLRCLGLVENWLRRIVNILQPTQTRMLLTEGYDENFKNIVLRAPDLRTALATAIREEGDIPSVEVIIRAPLVSVRDTAKF